MARCPRRRWRTASVNSVPFLLVMDCYTVRSGFSCLLILNPGNPLHMSERVDWAAMTDDEFITLIQQLMEPATDDSDEEE